MVYSGHPQIRRLDRAPVRIFWPTKDLIERLVPIDLCRLCAIVPALPSTRATNHSLQLQFRLQALCIRIDQRQMQRYRTRCRPDATIPPRTMAEHETLVCLQLELPADHAVHRAAAHPSVQRNNVGFSISTHRLVVHPRLQDAVGHALVDEWRWQRQKILQTQPDRWDIAVKVLDVRIRPRYHRGRWQGTLLHNICP